MREKLIVNIKTKLLNRVCGWGGGHIEWFEFTKLEQQRPPSMGKATTKQWTKTMRIHGRRVVGVSPTW